MCSENRFKPRFVIFKPSKVWRWILKRKHYMNKKWNVLALQYIYSRWIWWNVAVEPGANRNLVNNINFRADFVLKNWHTSHCTTVKFSNPMAVQLENTSATYSFGTHVSPFGALETVSLHRFYIIYLVSMTHISRLIFNIFRRFIKLSEQNINTETMFYSFEPQNGWDMVVESWFITF